MRTRSGLIFLISNLDIEDLEKNSQRFLRVLDGLTKITSGQKLQYVETENGLKIFEVDGSYFQSIIRWVYGQNRVEIHDRLAIELEDYFKFLQMLNTIYTNDKNSTDPKREKLLEIMDKHTEFSNNCINGLNNLCETYKDDESFKSLYEKYKKSM